MQPSRFSCLCAAAFMAVVPLAPSGFLNSAKERIDLTEKVSALKSLIRRYPLTIETSQAREHLVSLLIGSNRFEEALQAYRTTHPSVSFGGRIDFKLLDLMLKTGRYSDVLHDTSRVNATGDFFRDLELLEIRVQALLAQGQYGTARQAVDQWMLRYRSDARPGTRFELDFTSIKALGRHLAALERRQGTYGKPLFTASVPDSLQHWSQRQDVPIHFFKLMPTHAAGQLPPSMLPGSRQGDAFFTETVDNLNRGFAYLSGGGFSVSFKGVDTLYIKDSDLAPADEGGRILTSRVYVHTIPQLYKLAGDGFVVLVDYRQRAADEAAYMGDGIVHLSATKLDTMILMHEILHGLGATHQDWSALQAKGYRFDPDDRGIMTFEKGQIATLGLEEKNRAVLGWPQVARMRFGATDVASLPAAPAETLVAFRPADSATE